MSGYTLEEYLSGLPQDERDEYLKILQDAREDLTKPMERKMFDLEANKAVPDTSYIQLVAKVERLEAENAALRAKVEELLERIEGLEMKLTEANLLIEEWEDGIR